MTFQEIERLHTNRRRKQDVLLLASLVILACFSAWMGL